jgi:superoxide dismutase, Cu-Zn family
MMLTARRAICAALFSGVLFAAETAMVEMKNAEGTSLGNVRLTTVNADGTGGVRFTLDLHGLPPGEHAFHVHQNSKCDPPKFTTAGPHFNPDHKQHGRDNPNGPHAGDMDNFVVGQDGMAQVELIDPNVDLGTDSHSVFSNGGTALVIHAKPDDMKTDPSGNSGDRIACGVVVK